LKRKWRKATGINLIENGFRNSFASYALAIEEVKGIGHLAIEMGDSEEICRSYYVTSLEPKIGEKWFGIRPPALPANVVPMETAVAA
jgi:hypothetical protein